MARIEAAGGKVIQWNGSRVFGVLAMSRSISIVFLIPDFVGFCLLQKLGLISA